MLDAINYQDFKSTKYLEWTFKKRRHYKLDKVNNICEVYWKVNKVVLNLNDYRQSKVFIHGFKNESDMAGLNQWKPVVLDELQKASLLNKPLFIGRPILTKIIIILGYWFTIR